MQRGAHGQGRVGIDGAVAFLDELDDALLVDDDVGAQSPFIGFIVLVVTLEDAVGLEHLAVHVAEERKFNADLLGEGGVGSGTIHTDTEDFRIRGVNLTGGDSSLDRLKLLRSTASESQDVDGEKDVFLAAIVAELHGFPLIAEQGGTAARAAATRSPRAILRFIENLRSKLGYEWKQKVATCHSSNTTGMGKLFPRLARGEMGEPNSKSGSI